MPEFRQLALSTPHGLIGSCFGAGLSRFAPGTVGSAVALLPCWWMRDLDPVTYWVVLIAAFAVGVWAAARIGQDTGQHDHGGIVWDELVGMMLTLFMAPEGWGWMLYGLLMFRLFDVLKPPPVDWLDKRLQGGLGVMVDDIVAALMAWVVVQGTASLMGA